MIISWQDAVFSVGGLIGTIAILPSILTTHKPDRVTSLMWALISSVYIPAEISLHLPFDATVTTLTALFWWVLYFQARWCGSK